MDNHADSASVNHPEGHSFEQWVEAAAWYAKEYLDFWPFQVSEMASDWAWRMEGCTITLENLHDAYEDWTSGFNPYCRAHGIDLEGYDQQGQYAHDSRIAQREIVDLAISMGIDNQIAQRLSEDIYKNKGDSMGIYNDEKYYREWIDEWLNGNNHFSPHYVPLDKLNILEREERAEDLRFNKILETGKDWRKEIFDPGHMTDLS